MGLVTLTTSQWTPIGPAPIKTAGGLIFISGRIEAAAPDPTNPTVIYIGGDSGGIWKNINPPNWTPLTDFKSSLKVNGYHTVVVHPADHNLVLGLVSWAGAGILKSTDGGNSWQLLANSQFDGQGLNALAVHPTDTNTMCLAAGWFGAWKSTDGGATWKPLTNLPSGFVCDIIQARFDPNTLYTGVARNGGAQQAQNGVYQSTDSGATWTLLGGGLPPGSALRATNGNPASIRLDSANASGVVYVTTLTVGPSPPPQVNAVQRFQTTDGGATWTALSPTGPKLENRSWHLIIAVDPADPKHVLANDAYQLFESTDSGGSWTQADAGVGYLSAGHNHFDFVDVTFDANGKAVVTADQGVLHYDPVTKLWTSLMGNLEVSEFYTIGLDPTTSSAAYAVGQDIFSEKFTGDTQWDLMEGGIGETGRIIVNPKNVSQLFGFNPLDTGNFVMRSPDAGTTWVNIFQPAVLSASFLTIYGQKQYGFAYASQKALAMDPSNPARLLMVADQVFETTNAGAASPTWAPISSVLSKDANNPFIIAIAIAPSDVNTVYASTWDGLVWVTHNDGVTWTEHDSGLPLQSLQNQGAVVDFRIDPVDRDHVLAITGRDVWHLPPSGLPWMRITGDLPGNINFYTLFVVWQSAIPALFVGTDRGLYRSFDLGQTWHKWGPALPNTQINDLQGEIIGGQLLLAACTFGRGAWEILINPWGSVATAIANSGFFGNVCFGSFADELLTINNNGWGPLLISNITSSDLEFEPPSVLSYPLLVNAGESIDVVIRFRPNSLGVKPATITVFSNDPAGPHTINVSGECPAPRLSLLMANSGDFGKACVGCFVDEPLILSNAGKCTVTVSGITSSLAEFVVPKALLYPITIGPGNALPVPIRFQPTSFGPKSATITVTSDDPASPATINVSGEAPSGKVAVAGSTYFGGVTACCCADRTISICNVGKCDLNVTRVALKRKSSHWRLIRNPFPAVLSAGSCLPVVIQYRATERCSRSCELVIESDDPMTAVKILDVLAYTNWEEGCCKEHCEDCRKERCEKRHKETCCQQGYPCCSDDDEDSEEDDAH